MVRDQPTSPELRSLLQSIFVVDPLQRATIPQIMQHPWFRQGLPSYALRMNDDLLALQQHAGDQTTEEILSILQQANEAPGHMSVTASTMADEQSAEVVWVGLDE